MKSFKKAFAVFLAAVMCVGVMPAAAFAAPENTPKEEVVYVNLNSDGSVKEINVVNIFDLTEDGQIIDYGKYETLRNMTTTDEIDYSGDCVTINAESGKLYYEGKLDSDVMPWNISIHYFIDGKEYSGEEVAGKSGNLKITASVTENKNCKGDFFNGYALQASFTLDTKKCANIHANGATVANVGSNKQLTYTILPGKGADIEITADVTDFEMEPVAVNGVRLNLSIDIDEAAIQDKLNEITGAVGTLNDGSAQLNSGAQKLSDGTALLNEKTGELYTAVGALNGGAQSLANGLNTITSYNADLVNGAYTAFSGLCSAAQGSLNTQLEANDLSPVTLTPESYSSVLTGLLAQMDADAVYNAAYNQALAQVTAEVEAQSDSLYSGYIDANADSIYLSYVQSQSDALYMQAAAQAVTAQLMQNGYSSEQAAAYLQTAEGQALIAQTVAAMTDEQKQQIVSAAVSSLTDEQKAQIKAGALASLTDEQKQQIKSGYIDQTMNSQTVTDGITSAVAAANQAAASVAQLKGQLDSYAYFYAKLQEYTSSVSGAAQGAGALSINMNALYENVGALKTATSELNSGANELYGGTNELKNGADEFAEKTTDIDSVANEEIDSMISSATGADVEVTSFVSDKNTNIESVQFVIKTDSIKIAEQETEQTEQTEDLSFWQKLVNLFKGN